MPFSERLSFFFKKHKPFETEEKKSQDRESFLSGKMDIFLVREITGKKIFAGVDCVTTPDTCYFLDNKSKLYALEKESLWDMQTTLDKAVKIIVPPNRIRRLIVSGYALFIFTEAQKIYVYRYGGGGKKVWIPLQIPASVDTKSSCWCISDNGKYLFFCTRNPSEKNPATIFSIWQDMQIVPLVTLPKEITTIKAMTQLGSEICLSGLVGTNPIVVHINALDPQGMFLPSQQITIKEEIPSFSPYKIMYTSKHGFLFSRDGRTELLTEQAESIFVDTELHASGGQITATAAMNGSRHEYLLLGTYRRNEDYPKACFYILKDSKLIYKHIDAVALEHREQQWTGYLNMDGFCGNRDEVYFPCFGSALMCVRKVEHLNDPDVRNFINGSTVLYSDRDTLVFGQMAQQSSNIIIRKVAPKVSQTKKPSPKQPLLKKTPQKASNLNILTQSATMPVAQSGMCPVCGKTVQFSADDQEKCPDCASRSISRLVWLYLKEKIEIEKKQEFSLLTLQPEQQITALLQKISGLDCVSSTIDAKGTLTEKSPFPEGRFDLILCLGTLYTILDDYAAVKEMYRILKPDAELLLWLGDLETPKTEEYYDRNEFSTMIPMPQEFPFPKEIGKPKALRIAGKFRYDSHCPTRLYGLDFLDKLKEFGFVCNVVHPAEATASNPADYGIPEKTKFISCRKAQSK